MRARIKVRGTEIAADKKNRWHERGRVNEEGNVANVAYSGSSQASSLQRTRNR